MLGKSRNAKVRGVATRSKKGALRRENAGPVDVRKARGKIPGNKSQVNEGEIARRTTPASKARSG